MQRPADILHRKKMSAAWFPYTAVERLWCQLEEIQRAGHSVDQCDRLKKQLHGALMSHLQQVSATCKPRSVVRVVLMLTPFLLLHHSSWWLTRRTCCRQLGVVGRGWRSQAAEVVLVLVRGGEIGERCVRLNLARNCLYSCLSSDPCVLENKLPVQKLQHGSSDNVSGFHL